jgi:5-methylcytosine-specific restriction endonuclease McrA
MAATEREKERARARYWRCREAILAEKKASYSAQREEKIAYQTEWNQNNREKTRQYNAAWRKSHPEEARIICRNRAAKKRAVGGNHTAKEIKELAAKQKYRCANSLCGVSIKSGYHADHVMPMLLGGRNDIENIQLLCADCNRRKAAKHPDVWARERMLLL